MGITLNAIIFIGGPFRDDWITRVLLGSGVHLGVVDHWRLAFER